MTAWVGDSRCILGDTSKGACPKSITFDEDPRLYDSESTCTSVRSARSPHIRVSKQATSARFLGNFSTEDFEASHTPFIKRFRLREVGTGQFIVCCSDGVWEYVDSEEVGKLVGAAGVDHADQAADELAALVHSRWVETDDVETEDITAVVMWP